MRRVLIVSPHFPPVNAPDHQRVRMSLPHLGEFGWEPTVLAVRPEELEVLHDPLLEATVPDEIEVVRTGALPIALTRPFGFGSTGLRALPALRRAGNRLLRARPFDIAFFSTTVFPVMVLGPHWKRRYRLPYVLDFQDPWLTDYYHRPGAPPPPGGRAKFAVMRRINRLMEPRALASVDHVVSVSPAYPEMLRSRYPHLSEEQFTVLPFGAPERDIEFLSKLHVQQTIFDRSDGLRHWVYLGRGGRDMAPALRVLFGALAKLRTEDPNAWNKVRLHFAGTSYAKGSRAEPTIRPIAQEAGVADLVDERPNRVPYFEAMEAMRASDAILVIGSDDPAYTASKIYPCVLARRPILGIFHEASSAARILREVNAGDCVTFSSGQAPEARLGEAATAMRRLLELDPGAPPTTDWDAFHPYTAREMTRRLCEIFDRCCQDNRTEPTSDN